jgi:ABC-type oligopeptide transport system substrate-binding subunit
MRAFAAALALALTVAAAPAWPRSAPAAAPAHGLSIHGDLKYPPGFAHFAYVNPRAPKGGSVTLSARDVRQLNPFILKAYRPPASP